MAQATKGPRATAGVLLKFEPEELAGVERVAERMGYRRATAIKKLLAAVVKRSDAEHGED